MLPDWQYDDVAAFFAVVGGVIGGALGATTGFLIGLGVGAIIGGVVDACLNRFLHCWPLPVAGGVMIVMALVSSFPAALCFPLFVAVPGMYVRDYAMQVAAKRS